jgi:glycosyltransferase involved in cell wall biosynthesis
MTTPSIILVRKQGLSAWKSCQSITGNLQAAYQLAFPGELHIAELPERATGFEAMQLAKEIVSQNPKIISFIDHSPHPIDLVEGLAYLYREKRERPILRFHLFGDFVLFCRQWHGLSQALEGFPVQWIAASHRQCELVERFLNANSVHRIPFPVDESYFTPMTQLRDSARSEFGFAQDELAVIYTGRMSLQKNVIELVQTFSRVLDNSDLKATLLCAGPMDDMGSPYLGITGILGTFSSTWHELMAKIPAGRVRYLGNLTEERLRLLYQAADLYAGFSCHNDEDYGMSPAEALCSGLPCVLSNWGGFSSFEEVVPSAVSLVDIEMGKGRNSVMAQSAFKQLSKALFSQNLDHNKRHSIAQTAQAQLGIKAVSHMLKNLPQAEKSNGFNSNFLKLVSSFQNMPQAPFKVGNYEYSEFYREIYAPYAGQAEKKI